MRVPDLLLRGVGFVSEVVGPDSDPDPIATSFFVSVPSLKVPNARFAYAVTAKHVIRTLPNTKTVVVVNKRGGGGLVTLPLVAGWFPHQDPSVDAVVSPIALNQSFEITGFDAEDVFDESNNVENIGIGDEVFFPGLFTVAPGI